LRRADFETGVDDQIAGRIDAGIKALGASQRGDERRERRYVDL
jgi:hypothetical protein